MPADTGVVEDERRAIVHSGECEGIRAEGDEQQLEVQGCGLRFRLILRADASERE